MQIVAPRPISAGPHSWSNRRPLRSSTRRTFTSTGSTGRAEGEAGHRVGRVTPDARKLRQILGPAVLCDVDGGAVEIHGSAVVAETFPGTDDVRARRLRQRVHCGPPLEPLGPARHDPRHLRLLKHHLAHEHRVRVAGVPPGQVARVRGEPAPASRCFGACAQRRRRSSTSKMLVSTQLTMVMIRVAHTPDMNESISKPDTIQLVM